MLYYPQLSTGAVAQYPLARHHTTRTLVNELVDGRRLKLSDPDASRVLWLLEYSGLSDAERGAIESLFREAEGRLRPFVFLDPLSNLLRWSESLSNEVWIDSGLIQRNGGTEDMHGTSRATRLVNTGQSWHRLSQHVEGPATYRYCFSLQARSSAGTQVRLGLSHSGAAEHTTYELGSQWRHLQISAALGGDSSELSCWLELEGGGVTDVFGTQLQAQPSPSVDRKTEATSGVYRRTRFAEDQIEFTAEAVDNHRTKIRLISLEGDSQ